MSKTLVIVHAGLAGATGLEDLAITNDEGMLLATSTANLLAQFDIAPDPKTQAIIGMIMACGTVYGPRAVLIKMKRDQERAEKKAGKSGQGTAGVYDINGRPVGTTDFTAAPSQ